MTFEEVKHELWLDLVGWGAKDLASTILQFVEDKAEEVGLEQAMRHYGVGWLLLNNNEEYQDD